MSVETDVLPLSLFVKGEEGRIILYLPAMEGEPLNPVLRYHDTTSVNFIRSETDDVLLTDIDPEIIIELSKVTKVLVLECDADKCIEQTEEWLEALAAGKEYDGDENFDEEDLYRNVYEARVYF